MFGMGGGDGIHVKITGDASDLQRATSSAESSVTGLQKKVAGASAAISAGVAAGFGASVKAAADFDQSMTESMAVMGEVSSEMEEKLGQKAREVAKTTVHSHRNAADSYYFLASAGMSAEESLAALPQVADFAAAGAVDMAKATDYATDIAKGFGIEAQNLDRVMDTMTGTFTRHNQTAQGMGEALSQVAPIASGLGVSIEETATAIGLMGDAGIKGSKAGRMLRQGFKRLVDPPKTVAEKMEQMGIQTRDSEGKMLSLAAIMGQLEDAGATTADMMEIFGARAGPGMQVLLNEGEGAIKAETQAISDMGGITQKVADKQMQTFNHQVGILKSNVVDLGVSIGQVLLPHLGTLVSKINDVVSRFSSWVNAGNEMKVITAGVGVVIAGLIPAMNLLIGALGGVSGALAIVKAAFLAFTGPIGLAMAAVAAFAMAYQTNFAGIRDATHEVLNVIRSQFIPELRSAFEGIHNGMVEVGSAAKYAFGPILDLLPPVNIEAGRTSDTFRQMATVLVSAIRGAADIVKTALRTLSGILVTDVRPAMESFADTARTAGASLREAFSTAITIVSDALATLRERTGLSNTQLLTIVGTVATLGAGMAVLAPKVLSVVSGFTTLVSAGGTVLSTLSSLGGVIAGVVKTYLAFGSTITSVVGTVISFGSTILGLIPSLSSIIATITSVIGIVTSMGGTFIGLIGTVASGVIPAITGLLGAFTSLSGIVGIVTTVVSGAGGALLTLAGPIGIAIALVVGLVAAYKANFLGIQNIVQSVMGVIKAVISGDTQQIRQITNTALSAIRGLWTQYIEPLIPMVKSAFETIKTTIKNVLTFIHQNVIQPVLAEVMRLWKAHGDALTQELQETFAMAQERVQQFIDFFWPIIETTLGLIMDAWNEWGDEILTVVKFALDTIITTAGIFADGLLSAFRVLLAIIRGDWEDAWNIVAGFLERTLDQIASFASKWGSGFLDWLGGLVDDVIQWFVDLAHDLIGGSIIPDMFADILSAAAGFATDFLAEIAGLVGDLIGEITGFVSDAVSEFTSFFGDVLSDATSWASDMLGEISGLASDALNEITAWAGDMVSEVSGMLSDIVSEITSTDLAGPFKNIAGDALNAVKNKASDFLSAGKSLATSVADGIKNKIGSVKNAAKDLAGKVGDYLPGSDAKEGPLAELSTMGRALPETFASGILDNARSLEHATEFMAGQIMPENALRANSTSLPANTRRRRESTGKTVIIENLYTQARTRAEARQIKGELARALRSENL